MNFVRRFDPATLAPDAFDFQVLSELESNITVGCRAPQGVKGPKRHIHASDQVYVILDGTIHVELSGEVFKVEKNSVVFIPAGTPHTNWYDGPGVETHIDILAPAPSAMGEVGTMVDDDYQGGPGTHFVRSFDGVELSEIVPGYMTAPLVDRADGSEHVHVRLFETMVGGPALPWHIHEFDQQYYILDGVFEVDVAHEHHTVTAGNLVRLPAGVPHRNWNGGDTVERHIVILAPHPPEVGPWDMEVNFALTGKAL